MMKQKKSNITVNEWVRAWQKEYQSYVKESTYATYSMAIENHILPYFGREKLNTMSAVKNQEFILHLSQKKVKNENRTLSNKAIRDIMALWLEILGSAGKKGYVSIPKEKYRYPHTASGQIAKNHLTLKEEFEIMSCLKKHTSLKSLGIMLALLTGMRIGEICALQWGCIDLIQGVVYVRQTLQRIYTKENGVGKSKIVISAPKSEKSNRCIPLPEECLAELKKYQAPPDVYLLTGSADKYMEPRTFREYYNRLMAQNGVRYVTFHGLRHTFATRLVESGCDYKTISELLGHADVNTTFRRYVHSDIDKKRKYIEKVKKMLETD